MHSILPEKVALPPSAERTAATQSLSRLPDVILEEGAKRLGAAGLTVSGAVCKTSHLLPYIQPNQPITILIDQLVTDAEAVDLAFAIDIFRSQ